jgi:ABC-type transport system substrate-binding protein
MPTGSAWYDATGVFATEQDVAKAKQLLADAGYPNGLTFEYLGLPQYPELLKTGQVVKSGGPINATGYSNPTVDAIIDKGLRATTRPPERTCTVRFARPSRATLRSSSFTKRRCTI